MHSDDYPPPPEDVPSFLQERAIEPLPQEQKPASAPLFSPGDLLGFYTPQPILIRVAGRVIHASKYDLIVADAFGAVPVNLEEESSAAIGDLVVLEGLLRQGSVRSAQMLQHIQPKRPAMRARSPIEAPMNSEAQRLIERGLGRALSSRATALAAIRSFFERRHFIEVDTPCLVRYPSLDLHIDPFEVRAHGEEQWRGYLITSPEMQMKRLLAGGIPRCFQLAHCFRAGERGKQHNPEFTMLEWYRAFAGIDEIMTDTEDLIRHLATALSGHAEINIRGTYIDLNRPFERLTVADAFSRYAGVSPDEALRLAQSDEDRFFQAIVDEVEPRLTLEGRPIFLYDYPAPMASLARLRPENPNVAERFELYIGGIEICNGYGELTDPDEQRTRFAQEQERRKKANKPVYPTDDRFISALEEGMPPSGGNALGVDRLIALCLERDDIAAIQSFPDEWL